MKKLILVAWLCLACSSTNPHYDKTKSHHTPSGFRNVHPYNQKGAVEFFKWQWQRMFADIPGYDEYNFKVTENDIRRIQNNRNETSFTWIGHASFLIQHKGLNIITDPQYSERASPVSWAGPMRVVEPGIAFADLPQIDVVIISHDHYDSLDVKTIERLHKEKGGDKITFLTPLNFKSWFANLDVNNVVELDWWQNHKISDVEFVATPVQHWGKRSLTDAYTRLWAGWVIQSDKAKFYFAGDTGYCPHFKDIGKKYGPFDISLLPIGAYEPIWFMNAYHVTPKQSVQVHRDIASKKSIGMHWGTFVLTDEPLDQPPVDLEKALLEAKISKSEFQVWQHGQSQFYSEL